MYYTSINPFTMKEVYCENDPHVKAMQRALLQYNKPQNAALVREALLKGGREDLIGYDKRCLVRPDTTAKPKQEDKKLIAAKPHEKYKSDDKKRNESTVTNKGIKNKGKKDNKIPKKRKH
jgi:hypothetical protein